MAKRKVIRKSNRTLTFNVPNYYDWGGDFKNALNGTNPFDLKGTFSGANVAGMLKGGLASGLGNAVGKLGSNLVSGGLESGAGNAVSGIGSTIGGAIGTVNPVLGGIVSAGTGILGGVTNALFGSKLNQERINDIESGIGNLNNLQVDDSSTDALLDQFGNTSFGQSFSRKDIGSDGLFSNKAKNTYKRLKREQAAAINRALGNFGNAAENIQEGQIFDSMANYAADGGPITMRYTGPMSPFGNTFAKGGGIHIKKKNRGKFTKYCGGKVTSECIARGKRSSSPTIRKRATFAANARKWKHADGGWLDNTNGGIFDNGVITVGNGGTHEQNPFEGVQMGVDNQGIPNLVEEGEVIFNDYVYSNRIKAPKEVKKKYKLKGDTFADLAENAQKESEERPNDPISQRGLNDIMTKLAMEQETIRVAKNRRQGNKYPFGGLMAPYYNAPEDTMWDPMSNSSVYTGDPLDIIYGESKPYRFGAGVTPSGEWVEEPKNMARAAAKRAGYNVGASLEDYNENPIANPDYKGGKGNNKSGPTWLRYAPVLGSAIGLAQNIFSSPDYSSADAVLEAANNVGDYTPISYTPIGNYLTYNPFDRDYYINKLNAQAGATRRAIAGQSAGNRATAMAGLLAAGYNTQLGLGNLARQAEEYNLAQRQAVETFNRATNQYNSEAKLKADMANLEAQQKARSSRLSGIAQAMAIRDAVDARRGASYSANLTNLFNSLGDIGREEFSRNMVMTNPALYYSIDSKGNITYKNGYENLSEAEKAEVRNAANKDSKSKKKAKGGYLTISNRRRKR